MAETYTSKYATGAAVDAALDKAESALQPGDVGTAAAADVGDFATAAQGGKADSAIQPGANVMLAGASANLLDLQVGGSSRFTVTPSGFTIGPGKNTGMTWGGDPGDRFTLYVAGVPRLYWDGNLPRFSGDTRLAWTPGQPIAYADLAIARDAAGIFRLEATTVRIYHINVSATRYHRMALTSANQTLSAVSGATVATTGGLIPAGAFLMGVTTRVNTALGTSNGTTGYSVGNGTDANLWGDVTAVAAGTASKASAIASQSSGYTASDACGLYLAAQDVTLTATGGNFDGTGDIEISAFYFLAEAD